MLNEKQEKFAQAYVMYRNATEAAKAAGYSDKSAHNQGSRLLKSEAVKERIEDLEKEMETNIDYVTEIEKQYTYATNNNHYLVDYVLLRKKTHQLLLRNWKKILLVVSNYWVRKELSNFLQVVRGLMRMKKK